MAACNVYSYGTWELAILQDIGLYQLCLDSGNGIQMVIALRTQIFYSILTVLILAIVYATEYFCDFFFEVVGSVNLTSLLC